MENTKEGNKGFRHPRFETRQSVGQTEEQSYCPRNLTALFPHLLLLGMWPLSWMPGNNIDLFIFLWAVHFWSTRFTPETGECTLSNVCTFWSGVASGFISVRLADLGSGHTICREKKSSSPGEETHPIWFLSTYTLFIWEEGSYLLAVRPNAPFSEPAGTPWCLSLLNQYGKNTLSS